jgi:DNA end-binding protein Ku
MATTVWRGHLSFGLISIPVRLFKAARAERVKLRQLYREIGANRRSLEPSDLEPSAADEEGSPLTPRVAEEFRPLGLEKEAVAPIRLAPIAEVDDAPVSRQDLTKGFEYEKGRFVTIDSDELKSLIPQKSSEMEIQEFVELAQIDPVYFETSYYVRPEEPGEKAYALLYSSMQETGLVALTRIVMHQREHIAIVRPGNRGLIAHTMFFESEVRAEEEFRADPALVNQKELDLAKTLVKGLAAEFLPGNYHDSYKEKLEAIIAGKIEAQPVVLSPAPRERKAAVMDITQALQQSLAALKKPVKQAEKARATSATVTKSRTHRTRGARS